MFVTGYLDQWSYRAGGSVSVHTSTDAGDLIADIVRLVHGDVNAAGPGFVTEEVGAASLRITGRTQQSHPGSYAVSDAAVALTGGSVGLEVICWPTLPSDQRLQGVASLVDAGGEPTLSVALDEAGHAVATVGGKVVLRSAGRMLERRWYRLSVQVDGGTCILRSAPLRPIAGEAIETLSTDIDLDVSASRRLVVGALSLAPRDIVGARLAARGAFNGKIENPILTSAGRVLVDWAFEVDSQGSRIVDRTGHGHDGTLVNHPARAMTGHRWDGSATSLGQDPAHYGAVHFHDDDLIDAGWVVDAHVELPQGLPSGIYAIRLAVAGARTPAPDPLVDHIPFFVRTDAGSRSARTALLVPTFTYAAYANERLMHLLDYEAAGLTDHPIIAGFHDKLLADHPEWGSSLYDHHRDGSGVCYSSHLRPIPNLRPDYRMWLQNAPRHLAAELYTTKYLETVGIGYEVITDHDLDREGPEALAGYDVVLTGSHPEYYSGRMLDVVQGHLDSGGSLLYLGGNGFYWVTSAAPDEPDRLEVRRSSGIRTWEVGPGEHHHSTTGELGGLWRWRGRPPHAMVGVGMCSQGWDEKAPPFRRTEASYTAECGWVFAGVAAELIGDSGLIMNGASGDELDCCDVALGSPPNTVVLATSDPHTDYYQLAVEDALMIGPGLGGSECESVRSDMVLVEQPSGGAVFSVGSICFTGALPIDGFDNDAATVVTNVLRNFLGRTRNPVNSH